MFTVPELTAEALGSFLAAARIARAIEFTRFPPSAETDDEGTKRARSCEPPTLLDSSAILTISERPMHFIMNLTSSA
jgi:hypothetical protein